MATPVSPRIQGLGGSELARSALAFARERHAGQLRDGDGAPFVTHPLEVAALLEEAGYPGEVVAAGVLHDVVENSATTPAEIEERFGPDVARLVLALTEDDALRDDVARRAALRRQVARSGERAAAIFAADKVSKTRELRLLASRGPLPESARAKLEHYERSHEMLSELLPGHPLVERLRMELEAVAALPAAGL